MERKKAQHVRADANPIWKIYYDNTSNVNNAMNFLNRKHYYIYIVGNKIVNKNKTAKEDEMLTERIPKIVGAMVLAASACLATSSLAQEYRMRVGLVTADSQAATKAARVMAFQIEAESQGRIDVEIYPAGQLGNFREMAEQVQLGTLEMTFTTGGGVAGIFPAIQAFDLQYMLPNDRVAAIVKSDPELISLLREETLKATGSLRLMNVSNSGRWRSFFTRGRKVETASDLEGLKIRTISSPIQGKFVEALGANPTPVPWPELYTSFSTGVVDGTKNAISSITSMRFDEFVKYGVIDNHSYIWEFWWANNDWWNDLPPDLQDVVLNGMVTLQQVADALPMHEDFVEYKAFQENGGELVFPTAEQRATFVAGAAPVREAYVSEYGNMFPDAIAAAIERAEASIADSNEMAR